MTVQSHPDLIGQTLSADPSSGGALTLGAAVAGYRALGSGNDAQYFGVTIKEGTAKEVRRGCLYTHSGASLAAGTFVTSTTGSAIDFTAAAQVFVTLGGYEVATFDRVPTTLISSATPSAIPSSGTIGDATNPGKLVLNTAFPLTYSDGVWLYLPTNAIWVGSPAGLYWAVMTDDSNGTVYYNPRGVVWPSPFTGTLVPINATPLGAQTGNGHTSATAYTSVIGAAAKIGKQVVPANSIGPTGFLKAEFLFSTSDPVAIVQFALGANTGTPAPFFAANIAAPSATGRAVLYSRTASKQVYPDYQDFGFGQGVNAAGEIAIDTTIDRTFHCSGWISGANDYLVLEATTVITQA